MLGQFHGDGWLRLLAVGYRSCGSWLGWFSHLALHYSCQGWDGYFEAFFSIWAAGCAVPMAGCFGWRVLFEGYGCIKSLFSQAICPCVAFIATSGSGMLLAPDGSVRDLLAGPNLCCLIYAINAYFLHGGSLCPLLSGWPARLPPDPSPGSLRVRDQPQAPHPVPVATTRQQRRSYNSPTSPLGR